MASKLLEKFLGSIECVNSAMVGSTGSKVTIRLAFSSAAHYRTQHAIQLATAAAVVMATEPDDRWAVTPSIHDVRCIEIELVDPDARGGAEFNRAMAVAEAIADQLNC